MNGGLIHLEEESRADQKTDFQSWRRWNHYLKKNFKSGSLLPAKIFAFSAHRGQMKNVETEFEE